MKKNETKTQEILEQYGIDYEEFMEKSQNHKDFIIGKYRLVHEDVIYDVAREELQNDPHYVGSFMPYFIAYHCDLDFELIEFIQQHEGYSLLGEHIINSKNFESFVFDYLNEDGFGNHFAYYDGNAIEDIANDTGFYIFRID